ncbi:MAG: DUF2892 domain-containing protein [bacterium]|nr:MAG: DUF2892 domain-containing protein [bacterium]
MKHNMGTVDRVLRAAAAVVLGYLILTGKVGGLLAAVLGLFAVMLIGTSILGYCPPYQLLGISTCRCDEHGKDTSSAA